MLVVRLPNWLGDAVMATPVLRALAREGEFYLLGRPYLQPLFENLPGVRGFIPVHPGRWGILRTAFDLRAYGFSRGLLLPNSFSSALIFFLAGIPERWGYATDGRKLLLTRPIKPPERALHQRDYYRQLLVSLGFEPPEEELGLTIPEEARRRVARFLAKIPGPVAILAPGAAYGPAKRWPEDYFRALAQELVRRGFFILILGSSRERPLGEHIVANLSRAMNLCGQTDLLSAAALIQQAAVFVSNDSGLMHVAAALRRPQVAIFGSTDPTATGPLNPRALVVYKNLPCSPCWQRTCESQYACLRTISVEEVLSAVLEVSAREFREGESL